MSERASDATRTLASSFGAARAAWRADLAVTRRVRRGKARYTVRDPITLRAFRLSAPEYLALASLARHRTLRACFASVARDDGRGAAPIREARFCELVLALHARGLVELDQAIGDLGSSRDRERGDAASSARARSLVRRHPVAALLALVVPPALLAIPVHSHVRVYGVLSGAQETFVRAETSGFLAAVGVNPGDDVDTGHVLARLEDREHAMRLAEVEALLATAELLSARASGTDRGAAKEADERVRTLRREREHRERDVASLTAWSPARGTVLVCISPRELGRYVERGEPIATISGAEPIVRASLSAEHAAAALPAVGDAVEIRSRASRGACLRGKIARVAARAASSLEAPRRAPAHAGRVPEDETAADDATFAIEIAIDAGDAPPAIPRGATVEILLRGSREPVAARLLRVLRSLGNRSNA